MRARDVAKAVPSEHLAHKLLRRRRIEHQVNLRLGRGIFRKGVVQEVVENAAVENSRFVQLASQTIGTGRTRAIAHANRQAGEFERASRQRVGLAVVENLESVLDSAQERVGAFEDLAFLVGQPTRLSEPADRLQRGAGANARRVATAQKLQELDRKFDVANAAAAVLHISGVGAGSDREMLDAAFEGLDAADVGPCQPAAVDPGLHLREQLGSQRFVACDASRLHPRLPLPGAAMVVVILEHRLPRHRRRTGCPVRPQSQVDTVGDPQVGGLGNQPHGLLHNPLKKLLIAARLRPLDPAIGRMHKHEVDVAGVVEFPAAQLAQGQHGERGWFATGAVRHASQLHVPRQRRSHRPLHNAVGHVRDLRHHRLQTLPADDVAVGDAERLPTFQPADCPHHAVGLCELGCLRGQRRNQ